MPDRAVRTIAGWGLESTPPIPDRELAMSELLPEIRQHKLIGVLEAMVREGVVRVDDQAAVAEAHADAMAESLLLEDVLLQAIDVLDAAGVDWRVLKGSALAHTLPTDPALRSFGDNDLLVRGEHVQAAVESLESAGGHRLQPRVSPMFDRRFTKSVTVGWRSNSELDLHRTLAPGPFGLRIVLGDLFDGHHTFQLAGRALATIPLELHLLHGAIHVALGDIEPRLGNVRDVALMLEHPGISHEVVREVAQRWGCELPLALGLRAAAEIGADQHPLAGWAESFIPDDGDVRLLASYQRKAGRFRAQAWASLRVLGWKDRIRYLGAVSRRR